MCHPAVVAGLQVATAIQEHQNAKALAASKRKSQEQTRKNANQAYLNELSYIATDDIKAEREKRREDFKTSQEKKKKQSAALNLGAGNAFKVVQDIGGLYDIEFNEIASGFESDMIALDRQATESYANLSRTYNSLEPVVEPSNAALGLKIASIGANYAVSDANAKKAKV
jgi:hypothetical protein